MIWYKTRGKKVRSEPLNFDFRAASVQPGPFDRTVRTGVGPAAAGGRRRTEDNKVGWVSVALVSIQPARGGAFSAAPRSTVKNQPALNWPAELNNDRIRDALGQAGQTAGSGPELSELGSPAGAGRRGGRGAAQP